MEVHSGWCCIGSCSKNCYLTFHKAFSSLSSTPIGILPKVESLQNVNLPEGYKASPITALRNIYKLEGFSGFFKGNWTGIIKKIPFSSIKFPCYELYSKVPLILLNREILTPTGTETPSVARFVAGGAASATAVFATYPLDLVQTKLAIQIRNPKYHGILGTITHIVKEEGMRKQELIDRSITTLPRNWLYDCGKVL